MRNWHLEVARSAGTAGSPEGHSNLKREVDRGVGATLRALTWPMFVLLCLWRTRLSADHLIE